MSHRTPMLLLLFLGLIGIDCLQGTRVTTFHKVPATSVCSAGTSKVAAESELTCSVQSLLSDTWRSFSFINGVCTLSDNADCAAPGTTVIFRKQLVSDLGHPGYETTVSARRFWVFQQRQTGLVGFGRNWIDYERVFGDNIDFWSGLQAIHKLTKPPCTLRIELTTLDHEFYFAEISNFYVANASTNYTMTYGSYLSDNSSTKLDLLSQLNGTQFSTMDRDNDQNSGSCSAFRGNSGFWFGACAGFNPNGQYGLENGMTFSYSYMYSIGVFSSKKNLRTMRMMLQLN